MQLLAKVKFDLRDPDEFYFAKKEIDTLLGTETRTVPTIAVLFKERPFNLLDDEVIHIMSRLVYMGAGQGFLAEAQNIDLLSIVKRATFFREIYVIFEAHSDESVLEELEKTGISVKTGQLKDKKNDINPFTQIYIKELESGNKLITIRCFPFQTLFEYVTEVKKLPDVVFRRRNNEAWAPYFKEKEDGIEKGINEMLAHLKWGYYRCPHFGLGKEHIGDFIDWASTDLRKPFLHYLHKYKGKGDPRISRALINLLKVKEGDTILDPFMGSGAFIADASTMGINAVGVEILNIGQLISAVKCNLGINLEELRRSIIEMFEYIDSALFEQHIKSDWIELKEKIRKNAGDSSGYKRIEPYLGEIFSLKSFIEKIKSEEVRKFLLVLLSQQIVDYAEKSRTGDFVSSFISYVEDRYLVLYSTRKLAEILGVNLNAGNIRIFRGDATNMAMIKDNLIDGIVTSPPYFDALDYIGNNKMSILILGIDEDLSWESTKEFYEPKYRKGSNQDTLPLTVYENYFTINLPESSMHLIELLRKSRRIYKARVVENYLKMMKLSFEECYRVLKKDRYYLMVISKRHSWIVNGKEEIIETSPVLADLGRSAGFKLVYVIEHGLSKADEGKIGVEDILVFQK